MIDKILEKLKDFKATKINFENNVVKIQIQLSKEDNAIEQEKLIKEILKEHECQITFFIKDESVKPFKKIFAICSGKGGVGKSSISLHIAFRLKELGYKVGILDADIYAPSIPAFLNVFETPVSNDGRLIEPIKTHDMQLLSMGLFLKNNQATIWRGPILGSAFNQFLEQGNWNCDYLIIDMPPGTSDIHMNLAKLAPYAEIILISEPNKIAYTDVEKMFITCKTLKFKIAGLIENKAYYLCNNCHDKKIFKTEYKIENLNKIAALPYFHHFHDIAEEGYPLDYQQQEEKSYFHDIIKKII